MSQKHKNISDPTKKEGYIEAENELQVGDDVQIDNISGQLMCSSKMGVNCLDLFNHVLTDESDLRAFLGSANCDEVRAWNFWKFGIFIFQLRI